MDKRLLASLVALLGIEMTGLMAGAAQAWQWYGDGTLIPSIAPPPTRRDYQGRPTLTVRDPSGGVVGTAACKLQDAELVFNEAPFGFDQVEKFGADRVQRENR